MNTLSRREFLKVSAGSSGGLLLAFHMTGCSTLPPGQVEDSIRPNAWLEMTPDGRILFTLDRVEMGQGTMTGLTTLLAEELEVDPAGIEVVFAPVAPEYRQPDFGLQITGASTSVSSSWERLREAGAMGRVLMIAAAARVWEVPGSRIRAENAECILDDNQQRIAYRDLVALAATLPTPDAPPLKTRDQYRLIGRYNQRLDARAKTFGEAVYGIDIEPDGVVYAVLSRPPILGGRLQRLDDQAARQSPGVLKIVETPVGVAVIARSYWEARKAQALLQIEWAPGDNPIRTTDDVFALYQQDLQADAGRSVRREGDADEAFEQASRILEAEYRAPFLAHATLEPQNCTAWVRDGRCDVWAPTQGPDIARYVARRVTGLSAADITIHQTFLGGGFGRRLNQDYVTEAVTVALHSDQPVKLIWSREEDMRHALYRPASLHRLRAALDDTGKPQAWEHRIAAPRVIDHYARDAAGAIAPSWSPQFVVRTASRLAPLIEPDVSATEGAEDLPYDLGALRVQHVKSDSGVPIAYWRAVGHSFNGFVVESFIDELAEAAGEDPIAFRLARLSSAPRHRGVLEAVRDRAGWGQPLPAGHFHGVALHKSFGSFVAQIAEVSVEQGRIRVHKVTCAVDCGQVVNPDLVVAQMEGGIIFGLTAALYGEITFQNGAIDQSNFHDYPLLRMNETPEIAVVIVDSAESPTGVGEPGLPPIAPAVAAAVHRATGQRLRQLPLRLA